MSNSQPPQGKKARSKQPVPKWQSWEKRSLDRKFLIFTVALSIFGLGILGTLGYLIRQAIVERQTAVGSRPTLIDVHPPEFIEPFVCNAHTGLKSDGVRQFLKNIGNSGATNLAPYVAIRVVPERRIGSPEFDDISGGNCRERPFGIHTISPLAGGAETSQHLPQPSITMPTLMEGEPVQLYGVSCAYYTDGGGNDHGSCNTYRFRPTNGNTIFMCDGTPKTGKFDTASVVSCAN